MLIQIHTLHNKPFILFPDKMHVVNKQCVLGTVGVVLVVFGGIFAIFWLDIFNNNMLKVCRTDNKKFKYNLINFP